jgi:hypothetical protein
VAVDNQFLGLGMSVFLVQVSICATAIDEKLNDIIKIKFVNLPTMSRASYFIRVSSLYLRDFVLVNEMFYR